MTAIKPGPLLRLVLNPGSTSVAMQRALLETAFAALGTPGDVSREDVDADGVPAAWLTPASARPGRTLLYLHGGGYMMGSIRSHAPFVGRLARACDARALLIEYRLAPEHPFPAALEDARTAWRWLHQNRDGDEKLVLAGESAGGGLSAALMLASRDDGEPLPEAAFLLSAWADLADSDKSIKYVRRRRRTVVDFDVHYMASMYAGDHDRRDPRISPVYGDWTGLPPVLIHAGRDEPVRADSLRLAEVAREAGVDVTLEQYEGSVHSMHHLAPLSREALRWIDRAGSFLDAHLS